MLWIKGESEKCEIYANPESVNGSQDQPGFSLTQHQMVQKSFFLCLDLDFLYCTIVFASQFGFACPFFSYKHISLYSECSDAR